MRKFSRLLLVAGTVMAVFAAFASPAQAGVGAGTVTGTVKTDGIGACSGGVDNTLCRKPQANITFAGVIITGTFTSNDATQQFVGAVNVGTANTVTAKSNVGSTIVDDAGVVNRFSVDDASGSVGHINNGAPTLTDPTRGCAGTYIRVGSIVTVSLACKFSVSPNITSTGTNTNTNVTVVAQFSPTKGDGVVTPITEANFTGPYVGAP